ncbi:MAG: MOP flippase family protein [Pseudomonadota bacterium]
MAETTATSAARWSIVQGAGGIVLQFATLAVLGRLLSPAVFGAMAILFVVHKIAMLFAQMGLASSLIQRKDLSRAAQDSLYWLSVALGAVVSVVVILIAPLVAAAFSLPELTPTTRVVGLTFVVSAFAVQYQALAQRELRMRRMALINLSSLVATAVVAIGLALNGFGLWALVAGLFAATLVRSAAYLVTGIRDHGLPSVHFSWQEARPLVAFGAHRFGAMLANAVNTHVDQFLVGLMLGAQPLGFYSVANRIVRQPVDLINPVVTRVAFPWLSRLQDDDKRLVDSYLRIIALVTTVNAPLMVAAAVVAPWLVPLLLGPGWEPAVILVQILAAYSLVRSVIGAGGSLLLAKGRADWTFYWNLVLLLVYPATLFFAARSGSITVLAGTLTLVQCLVLLVYHRFLVRPLTGISLARFLSAVARPAAVAALAGGIAYAALGALGITGNLGNIVAGTLVGGAAYLALARLLIPREFAEITRIFIGKISASSAR